IGYGLPCAMALAPAGFFVGIGLPLNIYTAIFTAFGLGLLLAIVATMTAPATVARVRLRRATGLALLLSVSLRWLTGGPGWVDAIVQGQITVLVLDAAMVLTALVLLWRKRPASEPARARRTRRIEDGAG
ncbi:hypothetical protein, partial [uncultured Abyssibacter sp.]|uniref:hypothetical protein n=1 Tax=uncultured Abyssibacter sp. TaxID=2320202 RepID=UPI0032B1336C